MATNQEARQASIRGVTSTTGTHNEDWLALFTTRSAPAGEYNERMLSYINTLLSTSHTNINEAMAGFAKSNGITGNGSLFSSLGTF